MKLVFLILSQKWQFSWLVWGTFNEFFGTLDSICFMCQCKVIFQISTQLDEFKCSKPQHENLFFFSQKHKKYFQRN